MKINTDKEIPIEELHRLFAYEPETGVLTWKIKPGKNMLAGSAAGSVTSNGYLSVCINYQRTLVHRVCYAMHHGHWPKGLVDHGPLSPVKTDNRAANLRLADKAQNAHNSKVPRNNTSGFKGVAFHPLSGLWMGRLQIRGKSHAAYFHDPAEASRWVEGMRSGAFGEFARRA